MQTKTTNSISKQQSSISAANYEQFIIANVVMAHRICIQTNLKRTTYKLIITERQTDMSTNNNYLIVSAFRVRHHFLIEKRARN